MPWLAPPGRYARQQRRHKRNKQWSPQPKLLLSQTHHDCANVVLRLRNELNEQARGGSEKSTNLLDCKTGADFDDGQTGSAAHNLKTFLTSSYFWHFATYIMG